MKVKLAREVLLEHAINKYKDDPVGFVMWAFPWKDSTRLNGHAAPDKWQLAVLSKTRALIKADPSGEGVHNICRQIAVCSGHGVGKSALCAWLILWLMSTRPWCKGTVTASTGGQLRNKTWSELKKWSMLCKTKDSFTVRLGVNGLCIFHVDHQSEWRADAITSSKNNQESFAGQHAQGSSSWYIFDEASGVDDGIWNVAEGGKTDGEPFHFVFGNPTKKIGCFYDCFHKNKNFWNTFKVDSRDSMLTNPNEIKKMESQYGIDSDQFRIRVLGEFPRKSAAQLISSEHIKRAKEREIVSFKSDQLIVGLDPAWGGTDLMVMQLRRGNDARSFRTLTIQPSITQDTDQTLRILLKELSRYNDVSVINIDGGGRGQIYVERLKESGYLTRSIIFNHKATSPLEYANRAAEMWGEMGVWLAASGCIKDDPELIIQLEERGYGETASGSIQLESKRQIKSRGGCSPDRADALALTFASIPPLPYDSKGYGLYEYDDNIAFNALTDY